MTTPDRPCPTCGSELIAVTSNFEGVVTDYSYWVCLSCDWHSEPFYYPDMQPNLENLETSHPDIPLTKTEYDYLKDLLAGLAIELPFNNRVQHALILLERRSPLRTF
ncbi:hypothetical protein TUMEXPCC7403_16075 [Tumidithrix helvetica PCC 7403]|uniref:hypothetical protein n=1 Tax=Tumidithrix helvetica TaxID=3457545 RepID=UPI003C8B75D3